MNINEEHMIHLFQKLCREYTSRDSSSITYEKSYQLMGAIIYTLSKANKDNQSEIISINSDVNSLYKLGRENIEKQFKNLLDRYNILISSFNAFNNKCLYDTVLKGLPEFFRWYDIKFNPQDYILTLDYPVLVDLSKYKGIDRIEEYFRCIEIESIILQGVGSTKVFSIINTHQVENIQESIFNIVYLVVKKILIEIIGKTECYSEGDSTHDARLVGESSVIDEWKRNKDYEEICSNIQLMIDELSRKYEGNSKTVRSYLDYAVRDISYDLMMNIEI